MSENICYTDAYARETDATVASGATSAPTPPPSSASGAQKPVAVRQSAGSQLTSAERSEYHYVERDLRDIAILTVVMTALLLLAWFVFTASGIFA